MYENLNNYKAFYTVARLGSISKAADVLFVSQPALSKSISKLEEGLGTKLFDRTSKGVILNNEGSILYEHIKTAFETIGKGEEEIKRIGELGIGQLRIGVSTSLCKHILLDYLQDYITENPHIKVIIDCHSTVNTMRLLQEGKIDLGLICETSIPKGFTYLPVRDIHDIFVASEAYLDNLNLREHEEAPMEADATPILFAGNLTSYIPDQRSGGKSDLERLSTVEIIEKSNLMMLEPNNITRTHIDEYLKEQGIFPNQVLEINNMDLLIDFASIGMGVACVVREFAEEYLSKGHILELPLEVPIKKRTVGFVYSNSKSNPTALTKFIKLISNQAL
ncbi:MAG: LysR family transcriptional regulator [Wujia sp.]